MARTAFLEYLNRKDFKNFKEIHTQDFVKHYNNSAPEDLAQEMEDAKGQFVSSMTVWRFIDGKIAEEWVFSNDLDLYRQLGLLKDMGSAAQRFSWP